MLFAEMPQFDTICFIECTTKHSIKKKWIPKFPETESPEQCAKLSNVQQQLTLVTDGNVYVFKEGVLN